MRHPVRGPLRRRHPFESNACCVQRIAPSKHRIIAIGALAPGVCAARRVSESKVPVRRPDERETLRHRDVGEAQLLEQRRRAVVVLGAPCDGIGEGVEELGQCLRGD